MKLNLASTRLAFVLLALILTFLVLSALIPQQGIAKGHITDLREALGSGYAVIEFLRLDRIFTTPYFYITLGLLAVNLLVGNVVRFRTILRVERTLLKARHLGSVIFHLSLLMIIIAIIVNYLFKYDGIIAMTEGQMVNDEHASYTREFRGPLEPGVYNRFRMRLDKLDLKYEVEGALGTAALVSIWRKNEVNPAKSVVHTNRPAALDDLEVHYGLTYGYSPELVVSDSNGHRLVAGFIRLATQKLDGEPLFKDFYVDPQSGIHVTMHVYSKPVQPDSLLIGVEVEQDGELLRAAELRVGDTISAGSFTLAIPRLRRWCYLIVVENPYLDWVFTGFWLALGGMSISFVPRLAVRRKENG